MDEIFESLKTQILKIDNRVFVDKLQDYYGFKVNGASNKQRSFADISINRDSLRIQIHKTKQMESYSDPKNMLLISTNKNWPLGYHFYVRNKDDTEDAIFLIKQSLTFINEIIGQ